MLTSRLAYAKHLGLLIRAMLPFYACDIPLTVAHPRGPDAAADYTSIQNVRNAVPFG